MPADTPVNHKDLAPPSGNHTCGYGPDGQCAACIAAAPPKCSAWGEFPTDADGEWLRQHGVTVAGPCKRLAEHDGEHSLVAVTRG